MNTSPSFPPDAPESLTTQVEPRAPSAIAIALTALWHDRVYQAALALVLLVNVALFVYLAARFANLPDPFPFHFDSSGYPDRIESKSGIFALPIIGITVWFLNAGLGILLHQRERASTIVLTIGALFVQVLMWLAIISIAGLV